MSTFYLIAKIIFDKLFEILEAEISPHWGLSIDLNLTRHLFGHLFLLQQDKDEKMWLGWLPLTLRHDKVY